MAWHFHGPSHLGDLREIWNLWVPRKIPPTIQGPEMPKSVEEAERQGRFAWKGRWNMLSFSQHDNKFLPTQCWALPQSSPNDVRKLGGKKPTMSLEWQPLGVLLAPNKVDWQRTWQAAPAGLESLNFFCEVDQIHLRRGLSVEGQDITNIKSWVWKKIQRNDYANRKSVWKTFQFLKR